MYLFGVNRERLEQLARELHLNLDIVNTLSHADILVTSKSYFQRKPQKIRDAEKENLPIYVLRKHSNSQLRQLLATLEKRAHPPGSMPLPLTEVAIKEAENAVIRLKTGEDEVELSPQSSYIRRLQHLIAERNEIISHSIGSEPKRRVRFSRELMR